MIGAPASGFLTAEPWRDGGGYGGMEEDIARFQSRRDISRGFADLAQTDGVKTGHIVTVRY